jgi:hypothetical protein
VLLSDSTIFCALSRGALMTTSGMLSEAASVAGWATAMEGALLWVQPTSSAGNASPQVTAILTRPFTRFMLVTSIGSYKVGWVMARKVLTPWKTSHNRNNARDTRAAPTRNN